MCSGNFVKSEKLPVTLTTTSSSGPGEQVALGSDSGALFIFHNFSVSINGLFLKSVDVIYWENCWKEKWSLKSVILLEGKLLYDNLPMHELL